ncbi:hypothetical protein LBMAG27_10030 [Bacteroidota bacterium]|nr:hypothetical protein LBMAG27_10030 [Bacteroidota bacterium]
MIKKTLVLVGCVVIIFSCKKTVTTLQGTIVENPYDTINYDNTGIPDVPIDSNSFLGIHKYIISVKCAVPGCHDGNFEPDFRTVQSSYYTLVFAPVKKNNIDSTFTYRVVPHDTTLSWLHERITTDDAVLGRMPLYDTLQKSQIQIITNWINSGAKDIFGNEMNQANAEPAFFGLVAYLPNSGNQRIDSIRGASSYYPFYAPANSDVEIWMGLYDDITLPPFFTYNKIKFSTDPNNFPNVTANSMTVEINPFYAPGWGWGPAPYFLHYTINTGQWNVGDIVYIRAYVQDGQHSSPTEIPSSSAPAYFQLFCSFKVQ